MCSSGERAGCYWYFSGQWHIGNVTSAIRGNIWGKSGIQQPRHMRWGQVGAELALWSFISSLLGSSQWERQPGQQSMWSGAESGEMPLGEPVQAWKQCSHHWRLLSLTNPMDRQHSGAWMLQQHFQAWADMPNRGVPCLASQPLELPEISAECSVGHSRFFLRVPPLVSCSCRIGSYYVNSASMGVALCYLDEGNNQHSLKIKYWKWDL